MAWRKGRRISEEKEEGEVEQEEGVAAVAVGERGRNPNEGQGFEKGWCKAVKDLFIIGMEEREKNIGGRGGESGGSGGE